MTDTKSATHSSTEPHARSGHGDHHGAGDHELSRTKLKVESIHCSSCGPEIEEGLRALHGVADVQVDLASGVVTVEHDPHCVLPESLPSHLADLGHKGRVWEEADDPDAEARERAAEYRKLLRRFWFGLVISIPVLLTAYPEFTPGLRGLSPSTIRLIFAVDGLLALAERFGRPMHVNRVGSIFALSMGPEPITDRASWEASDREAYARFAGALLEEGVLLPLEPCSPAFVSNAHGAKDIEETLAMCEAVLMKLHQEDLP